MDGRAGRFLPHRRGAVIARVVDSNKCVSVQTLVGVCQGRHDAWLFRCPSMKRQTQPRVIPKKSCASEYPCKPHGCFVGVTETGADAFLEASVKKCATENFSELQGRRQRVGDG